MDISHKAITPLRWTGHDWGAADPVLADVAVQASGLFKLATMNILADTFPWPVRLAISSIERFEKLLVEIERLDATVLGLNEVTQTSLQMLLDSEFVRANYFVTELPCNVNSTLNGPHGCVLLSKLPFQTCYALEPSELRRRKAVVGVFQIAGRKVAVCSLHTVAYQTSQNMALRAKQIEQAVSFVRSLDTQASFVMGDLNLHYVAEDAVVINNGVLDCWAETHFGADGDLNPGFTFDTPNNSMIPRYIPGETRRMRLDRILCCEGGAFVPAQPCALWGNEPVDQSRDIFLSDHFGLVLDLTTGADVSFHGKADVRRLLKRNSDTELEPNPFSSLRFARAMIMHLAWLSSRLIEVSIFFARSRI